MTTGGQADSSRVISDDEEFRTANERSKQRKLKAEAGSTRHGKVAEYVTRRVIDDIVTDELEPGDRLPAAGPMLERYQVGMASLREALRVLEFSGLIQIKPGPGGGPIVADRGGATFDRSLRLYLQLMGVTFRDVVLARQQFEPLMAREAAERATPELKQRLIEHASEMDGADPTRFRDHAREFHDILSAHTPSSPILGLVAGAVGRVYTEFVRTRSPQRLHSGRLNTHAEHVAIARAIGEGDGDEAERLMADHLAGLSEYLAAVYEMSLDDLIEWG